MLWTEQHDILFLREILHIQPWIHRHGSVERGQAWDKIAAILNSLVEEPFFKVTPRSVRDRYSLLVKNLKREENDTGEGSQKRSRRSTSNDFISYFSEKHEREISLGQEELKLKKNKSLIYRLDKCNRHNRFRKLNSCLFSSRVQSC